jgi:hypothetical protein
MTQVGKVRVVTTAARERHGSTPISLRVGASAAALLFSGLVLTACNTQADSFSLTLHNDTSRAVVVKQCDVKCTSFHEQDRLLSRGSMEVSTSTSNTPNWWMVTDGNATLGCIDLRYNHPINNVVVNISKRTACPSG